MSKIINPDYLPEGKKRHGGPYDRGSSDYYYCRSKNPHYYLGATGLPGQEISEFEMSKKQIAEYIEGWDDQKKSGIQK